MSRKRKPSYLFHKPSGQARVRIEGKDHYLGAYDSTESRLRYDELIREWRLRSNDDGKFELTIDELALRFLDFAQSYYRDEKGAQTGEVASLRHALRPLIRRFGTCKVIEFGPKKLKLLREDLIAANHCRTNINRMVDRIKRVFKWGVSEEIVLPAVYQALSSITGLKRGRSKAIESKPRIPVDLAVVEATLPHLPEIVADMVRLQLLTGARPGEICQLKPKDITFGSDEIWEYRLENHKTAHRGRDRIIHFGPKAQAILQPYLVRDSESYCFSPIESERRRHSKQRVERKTPMTPSQRARASKINRRRPPSDHYTTESYRRAIKRACEKGFGMPRELQRPSEFADGAKESLLRNQAEEWRAKYCWTPYQLRHTRATELRAKFGQDGARVVLGHSETSTTEIYTHSDFSKAKEIMRAVG